MATEGVIDVTDATFQAEVLNSRNLSEIYGAGVKLGRRKERYSLRLA